MLLLPEVQAYPARFLLCHLSQYKPASIELLQDYRPSRKPNWLKLTDRVEYQEYLQL